ncbi:TetR/AcrR family transcriptional regulator [Aquabacterium sp. A7-Y]|uniref:TetR/AcrR family transcriptional regulator n=1 Tax=Aquabacterium sp. A7-Y TaxID=1349605 RepID=UPI00223E622B|nr:TetR/AcrR family transcriptional regulator [Aquabacterium sp. A7-Y]MCW7540185.1 TetR/AcrR family transcriptional regulator [Aquabacterium sp. A7-Y]
MRVTREQAAQNRERVLEAAARLFRERGFDGIGVADLMKSAGLTHGGFYGQFGSKEALMEQACARAFEVSLARWLRCIEDGGDAPLAALTRAYLSPLHRERVGEGCAIAALGTEAARQGPGLRRVFTEGTRALVDLLSSLVPGRAKAVKRQRALATFAAMVGALVIARAVDDETLSQEVLDAVQASVSPPGEG